MGEITLARITADQTDALNALILRSKASWGYDASLMRQMEDVLRLDPTAMTEGRAIAGWRGPTPMGLVQLSSPYTDQRGLALELQLLFIAPDAIGTGLGRQLYHWALEQAQAAEADRLDILSDPYARGFYTAMGATFIEDRPSKLIKGRLLPWLEHRLH